MHNSVQRGVTLTELLIGLSILAILAGIGAPSFSNSVKNSRQASAYNNLIGSMHLARSEAIKRNTNVTVCARLTSTRTAAPACGLNWANGWLVFVDNGTTANKVDAGEEVLRIAEPLSDGMSALGIGSSYGASTAFLLRTNIRFNPRGTSSWRGGGAIKLCDDRGDDSIKALLVSVSGDVRRARKNPDGVIKTPWDTDLTC